MNMYFANIGNSTGRTFDVKVFSKLRDAVEQTKDLPGYIIRGSGDKRDLIRFTGGFIPSASETRFIEALTGLNWDQIGEKARKDNAKLAQ